MSRLNPKQRLLPSILDRLSDPDAAGTREMPWYSVSDMLRAILKDLDALMNTRKQGPEIPEEYVDLVNSIATYGMPDLTSLHVMTEDEQRQIGRVLEETIARFETRLRGARATLVKAANDKERTVRFRIDARLALDPAPAVPFETVLDLGTGKASIPQDE